MNKDLESRGHSLGTMLAIARGVLLFICGLLVFSAVCWFLIPQDALRDSDMELGEKNLTSFVAVIILLAISLLGFYGAYAKHSRILITFASIVIVVTIMAGPIAFDNHTKETIETVRVVASMAGQKSPYTWYLDHSEDWDRVQSKYKCCGLHEPSEWSKGFKNSSRSPFDLVPIDKAPLDLAPESCCSSSSLAGSVDRRCHIEKAYKTGCLDAWSANENAILWKCMVEIAFRATAVITALFLAKFGNGIQSGGPDFRQFA